MCGLVGIAGDLSYKDEKFMKRLLVLDYFRGTDSTGLAAIRKGGEAVISKAAVNPLDLFDMSSFEKALNFSSSTAFIGHNRAATLGKVNNVNAHPYQFGDIAGAHNGTLTKDSWADLEIESGEMTDTDSAAVFACINEVGIDQTIKLMERGRTSREGAWALTYHNKVDGTINFIRNDHRPLWFAFSEDLKKVYWASEWEFLRAAKDMTKDYPEFWRDKEGYTFFPFEKDHLYQINLDELVLGLDPSFPVESFKGRKLEGKEPAPLAKASPTGGKTYPYWNTSSTSATKTTTTPSTGGTGSSNFSGVSDLDDDIKDFINGSNTRVSHLTRTPDNPLCGLITQERFDELACQGCSFCGAHIDIGDDGYTIDDNQDIILCSDCSKQSDGKVKVYLK